MAKRKPKQQSKHDQKVRQIANELKKKRWRVEADIPGFDRPKPIGGKNRIPDVRAVRGDAEQIIEVETEETMESDSDQHATFRRSAAQKKRSKFRIEKA